jgi:hypothetical protein
MVKSHIVDIKKYIHIIIYKTQKQIEEIMRKIKNYNNNELN